MLSKLVTTLRLARAIALADREYKKLRNVIGSCYDGPCPFCEAYAPFKDAEEKARLACLKAWS